VSARRLRFLTKPALMPLLAAASRRKAPAGITAAQALSWGGDVALLGHSERAFLAGLGSFFGAHVAVLAPRGQRVTAPPSTGVKAALALWLTTTPVMSLAARRKDRQLAIPVAAYSTVLAAMFAAAARLDPSLSRDGRRAVQTGAALFLLSDTILGLQEFVLGHKVPALETAVMATYTAAQGLIAAGSTTL
jgi:uncharacterized membrane protein YhhN